MSPKFVVFVISCFSAIQVIRSVSRSPRTTSEEAHAAFNEYYNYSLQIIRNVTAEIETIQADQNNQLEAIQIDTTDSLNKKLDSLLSKIDQIKENLKEVNITNDYCFLRYTNNVEDLRTRLTDRTKKCTQLTSETINNLVNASLADIHWQENSLMGCYIRSLVLCRNYAQLAEEDTCFDFVVDNIAKARNNLVEDFQLIRVNFANKIISLKLPCQGLMEFEISLYPDITLKSISTCVENVIRQTRPYTCPDRYSR